jgi:hypothetical protein
VRPQGCCRDRKITSFFDQLFDDGKKFWFVIDTEHDIWGWRHGLTLTNGDGCSYGFAAMVDACFDLQVPVVGIGGMAQLIKRLVGYRLRRVILA